MEGLSPQNLYMFVLLLPPCFEFPSPGKKIVELMGAGFAVQKVQCMNSNRGQDGCSSTQLCDVPNGQIVELMGAGLAVQKVQCMNSNRGQDVCSSMQLCDLPDDILWHILSFLQLRDVVRTSTLSKRWQHLSKNNPILDISVCNSVGQEYFVNFVDRSLLRRDFPLKMLYLNCNTVFGSSRIHDWITAAIKCRVKKLDVFLHGELLKHALPDCVFNSETLIELSLHMLHELRLPSLVCLKNLKVLTLAYMNFDVGNQSSVEKLLSSPSLEELSLIYCKWGKLKVLHVSAPRLLRLCIVEHRLYKSLESSFNLKIHGTLIKSFTYKGGFINCYRISGSSSPAAARITLDTVLWYHRPPHYHNQCADRGYKLLKDLSCVKRLTLDEPDKLLYRREALISFIPVFCHLTELELGSSDRLLLETRIIIGILHKCPHLSHLKFIQGIFVKSKLSDAIFDPPPQCFQSTLEVIKICNFEAGKEALSAVKILLRTAGALKRLFLHPPGARPLPESLLQLLVGLPRASDQCEFLLGA